MKAEKKLVSFCFCRSITLEGLCSGIAGKARRSGSVEKKGGISELTNRLSHIRTIWLRLALTYFLPSLKPAWGYLHISNYSE